MRLVHGLLAVACLAAGCRTSENRPGADGAPDPVPATRVQASSKSSKGGALLPAPAPGSTSTQPVEAGPVVLPASGRVHMVNLGLRFVVIDYTLGGMPSMGSQLTVYRNNEKVGQVRLSGPEPRNGFVTADIAEGFIQIDDEVRIQ